MKKTYLSLLLIFNLIACFADNALTPATITLPPFNAINISGYMTVNAFAGQPDAAIYIAGAGNVAQCVKYSVQNETLYLSNSLLAHHANDICQNATINLNFNQLSSLTTSGPVSFIADNVSGFIPTISANGSSTINLDGSNINIANITVRGPANITINHLAATNLAIDAVNAGDLRLYGAANIQQLRYVGSGNLVIPNGRGQINQMTLGGSANITLFGEYSINQLNYQGSGRVQMYWLDSPQLSIQADGSGIIQLAGIAQVFHTDLQGSTHLDARYLRAKIGFIQTGDNADANVWVKNTLFTLATQQSDIYYYTKPGFLTTDTRTSGTVLSMHDIPGALTQFQPSFWGN